MHNHLQKFHTRKEHKIKEYHKWLSAGDAIFFNI